MTNRPDVNARGSIEVFEAHRVIAWHHEEMAGGDGVQVYEDHDRVVLVHHAGLDLSGHDRAEDAPVSSAPRPVSCAQWSRLGTPGRAIVAPTGAMRTDPQRRMSVQGDCLIRRRLDLNTTWTSGVRHVGLTCVLCDGEP